MSTSAPLPTTIALCITELEVGGAERALTMLAAGLNRERFRPIVYCLGPRSDSSLPGRNAVTPDESRSYVCFLESAGIEVHCLGARGLRDAPRTLNTLSNLFRTHRPALVQTFLFHANLLGRLAARRAGVPKVVCGIRVAERRMRWHIWLDRLTQRCVDRYVCVSESVREFSVTTARLPREKITVIPNGVDPAEAVADPADLRSAGIPSGSPTVVAIGRLDRQKGLDWLLETCPHWIADFPDWRLLLVGAGPEERMLREAAGRSGLGDRIHFAGWRADVPAILAASQVLVLPSRWEGMPNVVLQAMAAGLPVLASRVEGVEELLGPETPQQTTPFGDTSEWSQKLRNMLENTAFRRELGEKNRSRAMADFSLARMVRRYEDLWSELL